MVADPDPSLRKLEELAREHETSFLRDLVGWVGQNKKWWLLPIVVTFLVVGALVVLAEVLAPPFIYTLF